MAFDVEQAIGEIKGARGFFLEVFGKTAEDKLDWRPSCAEGGDATTILEIVRHLVASDVSMLAMLGVDPAEVGLASDGGPSEDWASSAKFASQGPAANITTKAELIAKLNEVAEIVDTALRGVPAAKWDEEYDAGWMKGPRSQFLGLMGVHIHYHNGQVAYIQRLYGDLAF
jgi:hypothetical protein